jgi:hypothetical protein
MCKMQQIFLLINSPKVVSEISQKGSNFLQMNFHFLSERTGVAFLICTLLYELGIC